MGKELDPACTVVGAASIVLLAGEIPQQDYSDCGCASMQIQQCGGHCRQPLPVRTTSAL